jgi:toxin-antitoxin system, toxin component, Txe/YoeB family
MKIVFSPDALEDYQYFKQSAPKLAEKTRQLIENIISTPYVGLGKPEPLKYGLTGYWSRRINHEHRLVYKVTENTVFIVSCRYHYK